jgi:hypothetical protein
MLFTDSFFSAQGLEFTRFCDQEHPCFVRFLDGIFTIDIRQRSVWIFLGYLYRLLPMPLDATALQRAATKCPPFSRSLTTLPPPLRTDYGSTASHPARLPALRQY